MRGFGRIAEGERILCGQRIDGVGRVIDRPAAEGARAYRVERELERKSELDALITDYLHRPPSSTGRPGRPLENNPEANA